MKRFYIILLLILPTLSWGQVDLKNGLVACYPFNANAKDESGNGNNGTVNGATLTTDRFGKANAAYNFDGNSYIALPSDKFAFPNYSYSVWIYVSSLPANGDTFRALSIGGACGDQNIDISNNYYGNTGFDGGGYDITTGGATVSGGAVGTLPTIGKWYHVAITRDNNNVKLYVDGILINTFTTSGKLPYYGCSGKTLANIGTRSNVVQSFTGKVDDIHLYNRPLTADEVKALFQSDISPTVTISADKSAPCGGDKIIFTANGASTTAKYQWKVDGVNVGTDNKSLTFNAPNNTAQYQVKITVEVTDDDPCFPKKNAMTEQIFTIKNCVTPPTTGVDLKNGLVACYPFNANAKDESGNGNNGTVNGATLTTDRFGKVNSAYNFNGSSFISVNPAQFKNQSYSYATWVYLDNIPTGGDQYSFISVGGSGGDQVLSLTSNYQALSANGFNCAAYNIGNPSVSSNWNGTAPSKGKWYHVAYTRDNTSVKLYVDGTLITNNSPNILTNGTNPAYNAPTTMEIGARVGGSGYFQFTQGSLDDIHIYNRPLNANEVKALFDGNSAPTVTITADKSAPCGGDKITFTANGASTTAKYQWKVDGVNAGLDSKTLAYNSPNKSADYQVKISVEVTDEDPCFPKKPVLVDKIIAVKNCVVPPSNTSNKILIPTAFTPNGDGTNDVWELTTFAGNGDLIVEIYNRWGEIVFYSKGYSEPWNGTYKGLLVPEGTYAYVIRVDADKIYKGAVLVVR